MKFCKYCGRELNKHERCSCAESIKKRKIPSRSALQLYIIAAGILAFAVIITIGTVRHNSLGPQTTNTLTSKTEETRSDLVSETTPIHEINTNSPVIEEITTSQLVKIDLIDFLKYPVITGFDGEGTAVASYDYSELTEALVKASSDGTKYDVYYELVNQIVLDVSPNTNLKNGDEITVTVAIPDAFQDKVNGFSAKFTVSGLTELREEDVLALFEVIFVGISGEAKVEISTNDYLTLYDFIVTPGAENLSNGDEVMLELTEAAINRTKTEHHIKPTRTSLSKTVQGLAEYLTSADQLPTDVVSDIAARFLDEIEANYNGYGMFTADSFKQEGIYLLVYKDDASFLGPNDLRLVIEVSYVEHHPLWESGQIKRLCLAFTEDKLIVNPGQTAELSYEDGMQHNYTVEQLEEYYHITQIS